MTGRWPAASGTAESGPGKAADAPISARPRRSPCRPGSPRPSIGRRPSGVRFIAGSWGTAGSTDVRGGSAPEFIRSLRPATRRYARSRGAEPRPAIEPRLGRIRRRGAPGRPRQPGPADLDRRVEPDASTDLPPPGDAPGAGAALAELDADGKDSRWAFDGPGPVDRRLALELRDTGPDPDGDPTAAFDRRARLRREERAAPRVDPGNRFSRSSILRGSGRTPTAIGSI